LAFGQGQNAGIQEAGRMLKRGSRDGSSFDFVSSSHKERAAATSDEVIEERSGEKRWGGSVTSQGLEGRGGGA
jgi:hypothetical protein